MGEKMKKLIMVVLGVLFVSCGPYVAVGGNITFGGLLKTGQTSVYYSNDDGTYRKGCAFNYTDNGDGTVTDNFTGLMWAKDGAGAGCDGGSSLAWTNAINWAESLSFATYTDWRLPNRRELQSLGGPYINRTFFPNTQTWYWSSSTCAGSTTTAWYLAFSDGTLGNSVNKADGLSVRAVRGGE
jgi:hypothetical protein